MRSSVRVVIVGVAFFSCVTIVASPASAALGAHAESVEADRAHLGAQVASSAAGAYTVHALTLANGAVDREFIRADGAVFAIAWRGASKPDLRQLLGGYFDRYQAVAAAPHPRQRRRPPAVDDADFIVESGGHSGAFWGVAFLPKLAPAGFSVAALK
jgi:hypothetical protein